MRKIGDMKHLLRETVKLETQLAAMWADLARTMIGRERKVTWTRASQATRRKNIAQHRLKLIDAIEERIGWF